MHPHELVVGFSVFIIFYKLFIVSGSTSCFWFFLCFFPALRSRYLFFGSCFSLFVFGRPAFGFFWLRPCGVLVALLFFCLGFFLVSFWHASGRCQHLLMLLLWPPSRLCLFLHCFFFSRAWRSLLLFFFCFMLVFFFGGFSFFSSCGFSLGLCAAHVLAFCGVGHCVPRMFSHLCCFLGLFSTVCRHCFLLGCFVVCRCLLLVLLGLPALFVGFVLAFDFCRHWFLVCSECLLWLSLPVVFLRGRPWGDPA